MRVIERGQTVLLKRERAEAYGLSPGPYNVLRVWPDETYKRLWVELYEISGDFRASDFRRYP